MGQLYLRHWVPFTWLVLLITSLHRPCIKYHFPPLLHCCVHVCWSDHVIGTEPLPSNGQSLQSHSIVTAVSDGFTILPWANMLQYYCVCIDKSQCFLAYFPYFEKIKSRLVRSLCFVCVYSLLSLLGNVWVNTFQRQWIHMQQQKNFWMPFSMQLVLYQRKLGD
jgi:hypothetical protein